MLDQREMIKFCLIPAPVEPHTLVPLNHPEKKSGSQYEEYYDDYDQCDLVIKFSKHFVMVDFCHQVPR